MANGFVVTPMDDEDITVESRDSVSFDSPDTNEVKESNDGATIANAQKEELQAKYGIVLDTVRDLQNPAEYLDKRIQTVYNTTAVTAIELIDTVGTENPYLHLDFFGEVYLSLICQISENWVRLMIERCLAKWIDNTVVSDYVDSYLHCEHPDYTPEQLVESRTELINLLPDSIREENSPDLYKEFKAVELLLQKRNIDHSENMFQTSDDVIEYCASFEDYIEDDVPYVAANAQASEDFVQAREKKPLSERTGNLIGSVIKFKYNTAKSFEDAMRESLGEYADTYFDNRDLIKQKKLQHKQERQLLREEMKMKREELKQQAKLNEMEYKARAQEQQRWEAQRMSYNNRYNDYSRDKHSFPRYVSDDGDNINPVWILAFIALLVVIVFLFKGCIS